MLGYKIMRIAAGREVIEKQRQFYGKLKKHYYINASFEEEEEYFRGRNINESTNYDEVFDILYDLKNGKIDVYEFEQKIKSYLKLMEKVLLDREINLRKNEEKLNEMYTKFFEENAGELLNFFKSDKTRELIIQFLFS